MSLAIRKVSDAVVKGSEANYGKEIKYLKIVPIPADEDSALVRAIKAKGAEIAEMIGASSCKDSPLSGPGLSSDAFVEVVLDGSFQNYLATKAAGFEPSVAVTKSAEVANDL